MSSTPGGADTFDDEPPDERPYGTRPYGTRPYGTRPYGTRPYGTRPYGTRPYGKRPYGTRPYGTRPDEPAESLLDPSEWSRDVADLFLARSALVRLGCRLVTGDEYIELPAVEASHMPPRYLGSQRHTIAPGVPDVAVGERKPAARVSLQRLWPRRYELAWRVLFPDDLTSAPSPHPEVAWAIKHEIARALALCADREFLAGDGNRRPLGIARRGQPVPDPGRLGAHLRAMVQSLRDAEQDLFERAGWVLTPHTLDEITMLNAQYPALHPARLVEHDGAGSGLLLGYPFVVSAAARRDGTDRVFFSSDWGEAWIAAYPGVVKIDVSFDARFERDETVIKAVLLHDFKLRREQVFAHAER